MFLQFITQNTCQWCQSVIRHHSVQCFFIKHDTLFSYFTVSTHLFQLFAIQLTILILVPTEESSQESTSKIHGPVPTESTEAKESSPVLQSQNIPRALPMVEKGEWIQIVCRPKIYISNAAIHPIVVQKTLKTSIFVDILKLMLFSLSRERCCPYKPFKDVP